MPSSSFLVQSSHGANGNFEVVRPRVGGVGGRNRDEVVTTVQEYSDTLLIFLLKGVYPEKYRELRQTEHTGRVELSARPFKDLSDEDVETMLTAARAFKALKEGRQPLP